MFSADIKTFQGEKLEYTVMWNGINIGIATISLSTETPDSYKIDVIAKTNNFFSKIYRVNDTIKSIIDPRTLLPKLFEKHLIEGKHESYEKSSFDHTNKIAIREKKGEKQKIKIDTNTHDPISCLYAFRTADFKKQLALNINSKDKNHLLKINCIKNEKLEIRRQGVHNTIVVEPELTYEGIFMHNGKVNIWFTDDEFKIPIKLECKLPFGKATALLNFKKSVMPYKTNVIARSAATKQSYKTY